MRISRTKHQNEEKVLLLVYNALLSVLAYTLWYSTVVLGVLRVLLYPGPPAFEPLDL